jgi:uncharacterized membrane protein
VSGRAGGSARLQGGAAGRYIPETRGGRELRECMERLEDGSVDARLERLERLVEELHRRMPAAAPPRTGGDPPRSLAAGRAWIPAWDGQTWLNRLGMGLLLLGVALLFRYSIDQGWLTPGVRVGFGLTVGSMLAVLGFRLDPRRRFATVLLGGGIATYYITGWAAFHLYDLVPYGAALLGMVAITGSAFVLALRRGDPALAILGAAGGLGTPLLLGISYVTPRGLALYASAVLAWTVVPYLVRGWRAVLWSSMAGAWALLASYAHLSGGAGSGADRAWVTGAAAFAWVVLGVLPLWSRARSAAAGRLAGVRERRWREAELLHWYGVAIVAPALAVLTTALVWGLEPAAWGRLLVAAAAAYGVAAAAARRADPRLARVLVFAAGLLLPAGSAAVLSGVTLLLALAAQALALHALARGGAGGAVTWMAHRLATVVAGWLLFRLATVAGGSGREAIGDLVVVTAIVAASRLVGPRREALAYAVAAHVALLGWLWRELAPLAGGQGVATIAWGACGLALLLAATGRSPVAERVALATLLATVAKLFLVDLARLEPLFRVLLFLGFGTVFLWLSYVLSAGLRGRRSVAPGP